MTSFVERRGIIRAILSVAPESAAILGLLALICWGSWATLQTQYTSAMDGAARDTANLAHAFEENTRRIVAGADQVLLSLRAAYARKRDGFDLRDWVARENAPDWLMAQIAIIGRDGMSVASTASTQRVSVADRQHFTIQRDSAADELYISKPVFGRSSKRWTIQLTRKLTTDDGGFAGIVVLSIDCYQLSEFYEALNLEQGYLALVGLDGVVRARGPLLEEVIGSPLERSGLPPEVLSRTEGTLHAASSHGGMVVSFRRLKSYPLVVAVAFGEKPLLAGYRRVRLGLLWSGGIATIAILGLGAFWIRQRKRSIASQQALALTLESMNEGLVMVDGDERVRVVNGRALELLGLPMSLLPALRSGRGDAAGLTERELLQQLHCSLAERGASSRVPGAPVLQCSTSLISGGGAVHMITDVTAKHVADERIRYMALHDSLTGLGNRAQFNDELDRLLDQASEQPSRFAVLSVGLNGFKRINDTMGQDLGEQLLVLVAERLGAVVAETDLLARSSGHEFAIVSHSEEPQAGQELASAVLQAFEDAFVVAGQQFRLGVSVGIAVYPEHGTARSELIRSAELAMNAAASDRSDPVKLFVPEMAERVEDRVRLEEDLRAAIENDELFLEYQPQFRASSLDVVGFEALCRWNHPTRGKIPPDVFIPLAEETGMVIAMGRRVLEQACETARQWPDHIRIGVNLSPVQFRDAELIATVSDVLARTGLQPARLELEVTEGVLIADEQLALHTLSALRGLGVGLALDDFGTGYASLSYLRKFPFERIKLDRSFVQAQVLEERSRQILQSILGLGRKLGLGVIAEGVETRTQLHLLRQQGCQDIQGYLVGKPMPGAETLKMIGPSAPPRSAARSATRASAPESRCEWIGISATGAH